MPTAVKRRYESPRRREQARATRRAVLDAARDLFVELGYAATTVAAIASRAGVSPETVYAGFKTKRAVLSALLDVSIVGDDAPVPLLERSWVQQMRDEPDPMQRLEILGRNGRLILERIAPVYEVLRGAAAADPEITALWKGYKAQRYERQRVLLGILLQPRPERLIGEVGATHREVTSSCSFHLPDRFRVEVSLNSRPRAGHGLQRLLVHDLAGGPPNLREVPHELRFVRGRLGLPVDHHLVHPAPVEIGANRSLEVVDEGVQLLVRCGPVEVAVHVRYVAVERRDRRIDQLGHSARRLRIALDLGLHAGGA